MPIVNSGQLKNVKLYFLNLKEKDKYGKFSVTVGGLSDADCALFTGTKKTIKEDAKYGGKYVRFNINPDKVDSLVFVDAKNKPMDKTISVGNGSTANVAVIVVQNTMGCFPMISGIQIVDLIRYAGAGGSMFEPIGGVDSDDGDVDDIDADCPF